MRILEEFVPIISGVEGHWSVENEGIPVSFHLSPLSSVAGSSECSRPNEVLVTPK